VDLVWKDKPIETDESMLYSRWMRQDEESLMQQPAPDVAPLRPTAGTFHDRRAAAACRDYYFPQTVAETPRVRFLNLEGAFVEIGALQEMLLPVCQGIRAGLYGKLAVGVITSDEPVADFVSFLAKEHHVPLFVSNSVEAFSRNARPVGDLTQAEFETFDMVCGLGGVVTGAGLAEATGLEPAAAGNRLANVEKKGYVFRISRSRRAGDLFMAPCIEPRPAVAGEAGSEPSDSEFSEHYIPAEIRDSVVALAERQGLTPEEVVAQAWSEYFARHREELREEFERVGKMIRSGDTQALVEYTTGDIDERATRAAGRRKPRKRASRES
jgi:hypothetical protein